MFSARHCWLLVSSLAVLLSCDEAPPSPATHWVEAARAQESRLAPRSGDASPSAAIAQLRAAPGEASQLAVAQAYFPEILTGTPVDLSHVPPEALLHVRMPSSLSGEMVLTTRGLTFTVRQTGSGDAALRSSRGAAFYGDGHFWMAPGGSAAESGEWKTPRVEELLVLPEGGGAHRTLYELTLPPEVTAVRDVGDYLELVDGHGVPVLRLHYSVARDAAGLNRQGRVRLRGAVAEASPVASAPVRYAVGGTLSVEMTVDLEGLEGPVVVDPGFSSTGSLSAFRYNAGISLLPSGKVLAAGGGSGGSSASCEVYDPVSGTWSGTGSMAAARNNPVTLLLPTGKVLVTGGDSTVSTSTAELYDPETGTWSTTGALPGPRRMHSLTLLRNGKVLMAGGYNSTASTGHNEASLYDPATGTWTPTASMPSNQYGHTATLLPSGEVLLLGGYVNDSSSTGPVMIYNPDTGTWRQPGRLSYLPSHTATLLPSGKVLLVSDLSSRVYDPATGLASSTLPRMARFLHSATLLPSGKVLVVGGSGGSATGTASELYDPATGVWTMASTLPIGFSSHVAVMLPTGKVLITAGGGKESLLYDPGESTWGASPSPATRRLYSTGALLPDGKVLLPGGYGASGALATVELYDPETNTWSAASSLTVARYDHSVTVLRSGKILVVGGWDSTGSGMKAVDVFDPVTGTWTAAAPALQPHADHTATLLPDGKVLIAGGVTSGTPIRSELYDPATNTWRYTTGTMTASRNDHTAIMLPTGRVLVAGGLGPMVSAELYDPATETWSATGSMTTARSSHRVALLPNGKVLAAGGPGITATTELYDPVTGTWSTTGATASQHYMGSMVLLPSGRVLMAGGGGGLTVAELYDPVQGTWSSVGPMPFSRQGGVAVLLPNGKVLFAGGNTATPSGSNLFDESGTNDAWRPGLRVATSVTPLTAVTATGTRLRGISEGISVTGGTRTTPANFPVVSLMPLEGNTLLRLPLSGFSDTSLTTTLPGLLPGHYQLFATVNGISGGGLLRVSDNAAPVAQPGSAMTAEDTPVDMTLMASDAEGGTLTYTVVSGPSHGTLSGSGASRTYTPVANYHGPDSFTFKVNDGKEDSNEATVTLTVTPVNDAPVALAGSAMTAEETAVAVTLEATEVDGDTLTYTVVSGPSHGVLSGTGASRMYTPAADYHGSDSITFKVNDGTEDSNEATVTLTVTSVNDAPVALAGSAMTAEDTPVAVVLESTEVDGDTLTYTVLSGPTHGTLSGTGASRTYSPAANYHGPDSITFKVNDGTVESNVATLSLTVNSVDDAPVALADAVTTAEETAVSVTLKATDVEGDTLTYTVVSGPSHGTLRGSGTLLTYVPSANYHGPDSFTFKANDGTQDSTETTVTITVTPVNDAPVALLGSVTTAENTPVAVTLGSLDVDGDTLTYTVVSGPARGTLSGSGAHLTYTPAAGYHGPDFFLFQVGDGTVESTVAAFTITVTPVNDTPVARALTLTTGHGEPVSVRLEGTDGDGDTLSFEVVGAPANGTLSGTAPALVYTPSAGFAGEDSFTYRVSDGQSASEPVTVRITVAPAPVTQPPVTAPTGGCGGCASTDGGASLAWAGLLFLLARGSWRGRRV
ncbi:Ig-like domain-containing protein [Archangium violaceum]|uniref:Ig-like domain-containing protein n=1 Tax=Archangium violaceum TaxID=83451 RepID=UPI002B3133BA|nr:Ig-like domain-containing protein [Archangium gephyra]